MKKSNSKKKWGLLILGIMLGFVIILAVAGILQSSDFQFGGNDEIIDGNNTQNNNQNDDSNADSVLPYISIDEMSEILNDRTGAGLFVYVGRDGCPACQIFEPTLREVLTDLDRSLGYFELDRLWEVDEDGRIIESDDPNHPNVILQEIIRTLEVMHVPTMVYIENGEVIELISNELMGSNADDVLLEFFERHGGLN